MLEKLLEIENRGYLVELANVVAECDSPVLWDGKKNSEVTDAEKDCAALTLEEHPGEQELIAALKRSVGKASFLFGSRNHEASSDNVLAEEIQKLPKALVENDQLRLEIARSAMSEVLAKVKLSSPSAPKIMLYELVLVALADGQISDVQMTLLNEVQNHFHVHEFVFAEIVERATALTEEKNQAISLVLE